MVKFGSTPSENWTRSVAGATAPRHCSSSRHQAGTELQKSASVYQSFLLPNSQEERERDQFLSNDYPGSTKPWHSQLA